MSDYITVWVIYTIHPGESPSLGPVFKSEEDAKNYCKDNNDYYVGYSKWKHFYEEALLVDNYKSPLKISKVEK